MTRQWFFKIGERVKLTRAYLDKYVTPEHKVHWAPMVGKIDRLMKYKHDDGYNYYGVKFKKALFPTPYSYLKPVAELYLRRI